MRFVELIRNADWPNVERALLEAYANLDPAGYKHVFAQLQTLEPVENSMRIRLTWIEPKNANEERYVDVNGIDGTPFKDLEQSSNDSA
jgi:hypothetical protein